MIRKLVSMQHAKVIASLNKGILSTEIDTPKYWNDLDQISLQTQNIGALLKNSYLGHELFFFDLLGKGEACTSLITDPSSDIYKIISELLTPRNVLQRNSIFFPKEIVNGDISRPQDYFSFEHNHSQFYLFPAYGISSGSHLLNTRYEYEFYNKYMLFGSWIVANKLEEQEITDVEYFLRKASIILSKSNSSLFFENLGINLEKLYSSGA